MALRLGKLRINRLWVLLFMAVILAAFATWLAFTYLENREKAMQEELSARAQGGPKSTVVVPTSDLPEGFVIDEAVVAGRDIATDLVYKDTITIDDFDAIRGMSLLRDVQKGRPLMRQDIIDQRPKDFSHLLTKGMRAITIEIDEINSIAQMLKPGNFIDLHLIATEPGETQSQEVFPFLQHVKVIATGQETTQSVVSRAARNPELEGIVPYATVTVEVTPEEAAYIALAQQTGRIRATLRPNEDIELASYNAVTTRSLLGSVKKGGAYSPATAKVEYIVGGKAGSGASAPISINVPGMPGLTPEAIAAGALSPGVAATGGPSLQNAINQANPAVYAPR
jgi:pilus assembly protein CpaB